MIVKTLIKATKTTVFLKKIISYLFYNELWKIIESQSSMTFEECVILLSIESKLRAFEIDLKLPKP